MLFSVSFSWCQNYFVSLVKKIQILFQKYFFLKKNLTVRRKIVKIMTVLFVRKEIFTFTSATMGVHSKYRGRPPPYDKIRFISPDLIQNKHYQ